MTSDLLLCLGMYSLFCPMGYFVGSEIKAYIVKIILLLIIVRYANFPFR